MIDTAPAAGAPLTSGPSGRLTIETRYRPPLEDPRAPGLLAQGLRHGARGLAALEVRRLFVATGAPANSADGYVDLLGLLHDPLLQQAEHGPETALTLAPTAATWAVDVMYRPGVLDPEGDGVVTWWRAVYPDAPPPGLRTGHRYLLHGTLSEAEVESFALSTLANTLIQTVTLFRVARDASGRASLLPREGERSLTPVPSARPEGEVEIISLEGLDDAGLLTLSRARLLSLTALEMRAIQHHYETAGRWPTDVELETFALTWSEHCCHKTFRSPIDYSETGPDGRSRRRRIDGLLRSTIMRATRRLGRRWVRSAFVDNAGIIAFDAAHDVAVKVETHNHPSAIEPFGGANTGVGGVIRDVLAVSARPIAATDVLCFGHPGGAASDRPAGVLPPDRVVAGVVAGVADYGNKMGVPVVNGAVLFDDGYAANPLVFCGCVGLLPSGRSMGVPEVGDYVVVIGGRTGRDGVHGATFSSATLDARETGLLGSVVQIGEPIVEKRVADALERLRDAGLYRALTDCGAGGLCSAVGELGATTGVSVTLESVPLKYPGLRAWEIWLSESQERMVLAVPPEAWDAARGILDGEGVEGAVIGRFTDDGLLRVSHHGTAVADLPMTVLHEGRPRATLQARWTAPRAQDRPPGTTGGCGVARASTEPGALLLRLLAHPTISSKAEVVRRYDHEVQGATTAGPFSPPGGHGPSDAAVLTPVPGSHRGLAIACGLNPWYGQVDSYGAAVLAVEEALRNVVSAGGDPRRTALLDNFAWGNPSRPEILGSLVRAAQGCHDASLGLGAPFVCGKDSLYNEYRDPQGTAHAIPGTLLITAVAIVPDVRRIAGTSLRRPGDLLYVVGSTGRALAGSHLSLVTAPTDGPGGLPSLDLARSRRTLRALAGALRRGLVRACHDCSEGGLAVALAEMALGGGLGATLDTRRVPVEEGVDDLVTLLFAETPSRFVVAVPPARAAAFEAALAGVPLASVGVVTDDERLQVTGTNGLVALDLGLAALRAAWETPLGEDHDGVGDAVTAGGER